MLGPALEYKQANQTVASASSDKGLTSTQLCSCETHAIFSDFGIFQAGSIDFKLVVDVVSGALLKVMLLIQQDSKEIYIFFPFPKSNANRYNTTPGQNRLTLTLHKLR